LFLKQELKKISGILLFIVTTETLLNSGSRRFGTEKTIQPTFSIGKACTK
jgi:hypothetical protein